MTSQALPTPIFFESMTVACLPHILIYKEGPLCQKSELPGTPVKNKPRALFCFYFSDPGALPFLQGAQITHFVSRQCFTMWLGQRIQRLAQNSSGHIPSLTIPQGKGQLTRMCCPTHSSRFSSGHNFLRTKGTHKKGIYITVWERGTEIKQGMEDHYLL